MREQRKKFEELLKKLPDATGISIIPQYKKLNQIPDIKDFKHFINCEISPDICPMIWEELEKVEEKDEKRYCKFCNNYVYRVDDEEMLQKYMNTDKCLAININLLENLYGKWDEEVIEKYKKRLLISRLFLLFKSKYNWEQFKEKNYDYEQILKEIFKLILNEKLDLKYFLDNNLDVIEVMDFIAQHIDNEELKKAYNSKRNKINKFLKLYVNDVNLK